MQPRLEHRLETGAQAERAEVPFPAFVDLVEPAVVQLVEHVQREMQVVVGQRVGGAPGPERR